MTDPTPPSARASRARSTAAALTAVALAATGVAFPVAATAAVSADAPVIINEVYGGGGNSGAAYNRDFIELYNPGTAPVDLAGWTVQYAPSSGNGWQATPLTGSIAAGGSLLVGQAFGSNSALPGYTADIDGSIAMSSSNGTVALVDSDTLLPTTDVAAQASVVDLVGYGSAAIFAGSGAAPATSNATSVSRDAAHTHTADNAADFTAGAPTPVGSSSEEPGDPTPTPTATPTPTPTTPPAPVAIAQIQGTGDASPMVGQTVTTVGIVTAHYPTGGLNGYVLQTPGTGGPLDLDEHDASDAIFVYSSATVGDVSPGDTVQVTGQVSEFYGLTQLSVASGQATVLADQAPVAAASVAWPRDEAERETLESMLLDPQGTYTVSNTYSTNSYGEVGLAFGDEPLRQPTDVALPGSAEAAAVVADNAARAVILDDGRTTNFTTSNNSSLTPPYVSLVEPVVVGGTVVFDEPVVLHYGFDAWRFAPVAPVVGDGSGDDGVSFSNPRTVAPGDVGGDISVASFNVLNYFTTLGEQNPSCQAYTDRTGDGNNVRTGCDQRGAWDGEDLARQQAKIVAAIGALDASVVGLMEIENSAKLGETVDEAVATLVEALNDAAGAEIWAFVPSSADLPPLPEQDVITNAIIYQPADVTPVGAALALGDQSGSGEAFGNAREPIAQAFAPTAGGDAFLFVVNHFKSKGSEGPWPGDADTGDGQGSSNESRVRQATALAAWVEGLAEGVDGVILAGDFNAYSREEPMQVLYDAGFVDAEATFDIDTSSYSFSGQSGSLDHILLDADARARATGGDIWNINSGESVALEYSRYNNHGTLFHADDVYRSSDHDPVLVGLSADAPTETTEIQVLTINDFHGRLEGDSYGVAGAAVIGGAVAEFEAA
ncbi:ExeM/NucH family extracellular endonuclease, partial [Microbacterium xanthum]|uniref:ExeM/NucH family extracellular endonuclease n=1 Tax=Microbacterium xanthum TaxID=3079794 RepID=UPI002AD3951F